MPPKEPSDTPKASLRSKFSFKRRPTSPVSDLPKIPRFKLQKKLGEGGMASVYLATQESTGRTVAIKIMAEHLQSNSRWTDRFLDEARRLAELSHPNIVPVFDWGTHEGIGYIVMEFIKGGDLTHRLRTYRISMREAVNITRQIASGLDFAGEKGYIHRDIKPDNVLFREDGSPCILDFGIAKERSSNTTISSQGLTIGTGAYMSPEQAQPAGRQLDTRSDLYSLGIVLYEMLTNTRPFDYRHFDPIQAFQLYIFAHVNSPPPPLPASLSAFQPIIDKLLAKNPEDRFRRGNDLRSALSQLEAQLPDSFLAKPLRKIEEPTLILSPRPSPIEGSFPGSSATSKSLNNIPSETPTPVRTPTSSEERIPSIAHSLIPPSISKKKNRLVTAVAAILVFGGAGSFLGYEYLVKPPLGTDGAPIQTQENAISEEIFTGETGQPQIVEARDNPSQQQINELILKAEKFATTPVSDIAQRKLLFSTYDAIAKLQPDNEFAQESRKLALDHQYRHATELIQTKHYDEALAQADLLEQLQSPVADKLKQDIAKAQAQQTRGQVAEAAREKAKRAELERSKALDLERQHVIAAETRRAEEREKEELKKQMAAQRQAEKEKAQLAESARQKAIQRKKDQEIARDYRRQQEMINQKRLEQQSRQMEIERQRQAQEHARIEEINKQKEIERQSEMARQAEIARKLEIERQKEQERRQAAVHQREEQEKLAKQAALEKKKAEEKPKARSFGSF